jgi:hypothetical protein
MVVFGLGPQRIALASSISSDVSTVDDNHARECRCANCHRQSCCCGSTRTVKPEARALKAAEPIQVTQGPCMRTNPCGDQGLPAGSGSGTSAKAELLATCPHVADTRTGSLVLPACERVRPARRHTRLDRPPEHLSV